MSNDLHTEQLDNGQQLFPYLMFTTLIGFIMLSHQLVRYAETTNKIHFEDRLTRIIAGFIQLYMRAMLTNQDTLPLPSSGATIIAAGPHRTGWEALALASKKEGHLPRFMATDRYNVIPGVDRFLRMFGAIVVKEDGTASKGTKNSNVLDAAGDVLNQGGCIALFPQGNFCYPDKTPPIIYSGAAKLAIQKKIPIHVVRLDGFWSINNSFVPEFIRNHAYYRAILSALHMNNVRAKLFVIDYHLSNENLPEDQLIREINAQLYAFFHHSGELTDEQIDKIGVDIGTGNHLKLWDASFEEYQLTRKVRAVHDEREQQVADWTQRIGL